MFLTARPNFFAAVYFSSRHNIKVVERAGVKTSSLLPGLKEKDDCGRDDCFIHTTGGREKCNKENIVYKGHCLGFEDMGMSSEYIGHQNKLTKQAATTLYLDIKSDVTVPNKF